MLTLNTLAIPSRALICFIVLICFSLFTLLWHQAGYTTPGTPNLNSYRTFRQKPTKNYAFATFLAPPWDVPENATDEEDHYYMQTRMICYQLVHDPKTRSPNGYPFVVLVTADVSQSKRDRLTYEGAVVKELEAVQPLQHETRKAWKDVITKLRMLEMVEYDRVAFFDSDHIFTRPVDGIFEDRALTPQKNKNLTTEGATQPDEAPQPSEYVFASNAGSGGFDHKLPPGKGNNLNAGIVVFKPSIELFNYHLSLTSPIAETRYNGRYPEQGLWGYAHRRNGNMPWTQLHWKWNINWANYGDVEAGVASIHTKYWNIGGVDGVDDPRLRDYALSILWKMEGYWTRGDGK